MKLVLSFLFVYAVAAIGGFITAPAITAWYIYLNKPSFSPPNWLFGPVWALLYTFMAISLYLVWRKKSSAVSVFYIQLFLNILWSILFFGLKNPLLAAVEIVFLWVAILFNINRFNSVNKAAAYLLIPYLLWVSFAAVLNISIVLLNKSLFSVPVANFINRSGTLVEHRLA